MSAIPSRWGLTTTDKDRVKALYPTATAQRGRFILRTGPWAIVTAEGAVLGDGTNAARAWEDAARRLPRAPR